MLIAPCIIVDRRRQRHFLKIFLEDDNEFIKGLQKSHRCYYYEAVTRVKIIENVKA